MLMFKYLRSLRQLDTVNHMNMKVPLGRIQKKKKLEFSILGLTPGSQATPEWKVGKKN